MKPQATDNLQQQRDWDRESHDFEAIAQEIQSLRLLKTNWDGYGAPTIDAAIIHAAARFVRSLPDLRVPRPRVTPMSPGNLQLEWHRGRKILELEFESAETIRFLQWNADENFSAEDAFRVSDIERAAELIRWFTAGVAA
jgi:hypothetical protein